MMCVYCVSMGVAISLLQSLDIRTLFPFDRYFVLYNVCYTCINIYHTIPFLSKHITALNKIMCFTHVKKTTLNH